MTYKLISAPAEEPITLAEAKLHLRETGTDQDGLISGLIRAAREYVENTTQRRLMPQTWELTMDRFESELTIYQPPLQSIEHIKYIDDMGVLQTMAAEDYQLDSASEPVRIVPAYGTCWPSTRCLLNAVTVRFIAGYADAALVPESIKHAMKLIIGHFYEHREEITAGAAVEIPMGAKALLGPYKVMGFI